LDELPYVRYYRECPTHNILEKLVSQDDHCGTVRRQQPHQVMAAAKSYKKNDMLVSEKPFLHYSASPQKRLRELALALHAAQRVYPLMVLQYMAFGGYGAAYMAYRDNGEEWTVRTTFVRAMDDADELHQWKTDQKMRDLLFVAYRCVLGSPRYIHQRDGRAELCDAFCLVLSRVTHDCQPNCVVRYERQTDRMVLMANKTIEQGERLTVDFQKMGFSQLHLFRLAGLYCCCTRCLKVYLEDEKQRLDKEISREKRQKASKEARRDALLKQSTEEVLELVLDDTMFRSETEKQEIIKQTHMLASAVAREIGL
jgi:hypothetical protein